MGKSMVNIAPLVDTPLVKKTVYGFDWTPFI